MKLRTLSICVISSVVFLSACNNKETEKELTQEDIVKQNIETSIKEKLNDPESYEFDKLTLVDSTLYIENIKSRKEHFVDNLEYEKSTLERIENYKNAYPSLYDEDEHKDINKKIEVSNKIINGIDSIENSLGSRKNEVASYTYHFSFRSNNSFGAKTLSKYIIQTTEKPKLELINITNNKDKVYLTPNEFPGYKELVLKYMD